LVKHFSQLSYKTN